MPDAEGIPAPPEELIQAVEAAKAAKQFQDAADALKKQASLIKDPAEREKIWRAAYNKEVEAHGQSKKALMMASGWGQGTVAGVGFAGVVGLGLGNLVGTLLSGVVAIPGALVGSGVGAIHGPWYGKGVSGNEAQAKSTDGYSDEELHQVIVEAARRAEEEQAKGNGSSGDDGGSSLKDDTQ
jgi:hypothetical protein